MIRRLRTIFAGLAASLAAFGAAEAQILGGGVDVASVTLHSGWVAGDGRRVAGLRMELGPGWKTYWRIPGDSGIPPRFDWAGSENLAQVDIAWHAPFVFETYGYQTLGYEGRMVLPLTLTAEDPSAPIRLRLSFSYGLCDEICIPAQTDLALDIAPDQAEDGVYFIKSALRAQPATPEAAGLRTAHCGVEGADEDRRFAAEMGFETPLSTTPVIIVEGPEGVRFGPVSARIDGATLSASGDVATEAGRWIDRSALSVTVLSDEIAMTMDGCAGKS